jgi:acyl-CoA reductase-like NAD-dependent aldehyde dehydrogenase
MVVLTTPTQPGQAIKIGGYQLGQDCTASSRGSRKRGSTTTSFQDGQAVESLSVGDPGTDDDIGMGPVISSEQQERVLGFLERATDAKATILTGGEALGDRGFFVKPTIVTDVRQDADIVRTRSSVRS